MEFFRGLSGGNGIFELEFDADLADGTSPGAPSGYGGDQLLDTGFVTDEGVFDGQSPGAGELGVHPGFDGGANGDLLIRWTADQDYSDVSISYDLRAPNTGNGVGYALQIDGVIQDIENNFGATPVSGTTDSATFATLASFSAGDTIDIIIFNRGSFNGDQTFGNFVIDATAAIPEPTSFAVAILGMVGFLSRRRR